MTDSKSIAITCARLAWAKKAENIVVIDVRGLTDITDFMVITSVTSSAQSKAVVAEIRSGLKKYSVHSFGREGDSDATWVLLDYLDVLVHIFEPQTRSFYDLENLWGDAPRVKWEEMSAADVEAAQ
ncbi:MAG: ribosome silencing factor [Planctomycetota bacterium]